MALRRGKRVNVDGKENTFTVVGDWLIDDQEEEVKQEEIKWEEVVAEFVDGKLLGADMKKKLKEEHPTVEIMYKKLIDEKCPPEVARDLCLISLYDVVVLLGKLSYILSVITPQAVVWHLLNALEKQTTALR